ncbi:elongation of very long chain fatty acids protein-like [Contarinia nasturtii]|uniref:elongation of very long chain fatty acids protein-like n=1 Tax=Contarinia nasturtii TaxID=265458 RepID=UPI0012D3DAEB|nr:elongation of very long chain fatty acids protein-like [Contarinia nasturtii]
MLIFRYLFEQCAKFLAHKDPRLQHLPFTSVGSFIIVVALYLFFVLKWGPNFMKNRRPYNLKPILLFYNAFQVFCNFSIFVYAIYQINMSGYKINYFCEELDYSDSWIGTQSAMGSYFYFLTKILDLLDTVFFVLRKRTRQISFLHVYHHMLVYVGGFAFISMAPGGHLWLFAVLNLFVHIIMYSYYFGTVCSENLKTNIFIKRSITQMQIIQFVCTIIHLCLPFFVQDCGYPRSLLYVAISQAVIMLLLFSDFYYKTYIKSKPNSPNVKSS